MAGLVSRGFLGRKRPAEVEKRLPPGQYLVTDFPVLSAGPTPHTPLDRWSFSIEGLVRARPAGVGKSSATSPLRRSQLTSAVSPSGPSST